MARVMPNIRSGPSRNPCYVRFINRTSRKVNVIWIDYGGYAVSCKTLEPNRNLDIHTYEGHPWICEDTATRTRMLLNGAKIFFPSSSNRGGSRYHKDIRCYLPILSDKVVPHLHDVFYDPRREDVIITLPVLTLLERSSEIIFMNLRSRSSVDALEIPTVLKDMLRKYFVNP